MTHEQIATMIEGMGLPYAYNHFSDADGEHPQGPPFICFIYPRNDDFDADNAPYARATALAIELYTDDADFELEQTVEAVLIANELPFDKEQNYIESERMYQTTYTTEVILDA